MAKVVGYCALHYGLPYLEWSIRSVIDYVDEFIVLYSPHGSHNGNRGTLPPIDSERDLQVAARRGAGDKLTWVRGEWSHEGQQRDSIHQYAPDADLIIVVDSDEIYAKEILEHALFHLDHDGLACRTIRVPIVHFWRSFYRAVLHDPAYPTRLIYPKASPGEMTWPAGFSYISHFGYALPPEYIAYKWGGIHGHQAELRKDIDWFTDVYLANRQTDMHPVGSQYWNAERVDPNEYLPRYMMDHPFYFKDLIV